MRILTDDNTQQRLTSFLMVTDGARSTSGVHFREKEELGSGVDQQIPAQRPPQGPTDEDDLQL